MYTSERQHPIPSSEAQPKAVFCVWSRRNDLSTKSQIRKSLKKTALRLNLDIAVTCEGFVPQERKLHWLRKAWAAVFASEKEGWGLTVIEANACGTPVIASNSDGLRDSVQDGRTGILVPHGDVEELSTQIDRLASDPALRSDLGKNGLEWAAGFNWDATADRMIGIMKDTLCECRK